MLPLFPTKEPHRLPLFSTSLLEESRSLAVSTSDVELIALNSASSPYIFERALIFCVMVKLVLIVP